MKKKLIIVILFLVILTLGEVNANEFAGYLPGGKNYIDPDNMVIENDNFWTEDSMLVKPDTVYTLSFPGYDVLDYDIYFEISGNTTSLFGEPGNLPECDDSSSIISCTFTTGSTENYLYFEIDSSRLSLFYDNYALDNFQLEEGPVRTSYEEYVPPFNDTTNPEFSGAGAYITSYQSNESITSIITNHVIAIDDIDGNISDNIVIVADSYTTNEHIVGDYDVYLSVSDNSGNEAFFTLTIMVKDEIDPVITGPISITVSVDAPPTLISIIESNFTMYDECDNTTTINITADHYSISKDTLGVYLVSFDVLDSSSNSASKTFSIDVVDDVFPVMTSESIFNSNLSNPLYLGDIINNLSFTDNYDDLSTVAPIIVTNGFSGNELTPGTYTIDIEVEDNSGNKLSETLTINVIDDILPVISGPVSYSGSYELNKTLSYFLNLLSVTDNVDGLSNSDLYIISDTYSNRATEIGNFIIVVGVVDESNNEKIHQIDIIIFDDVAPGIYVDNFIVTVNLSATFDEEDALKLLLNSQELASGNYVITTLVDEYTGNENNPGSYVYRLLFRDEKGETFEKEFLVKVADTDSGNYEKDLLPRNIAIYTSIIGYFTFVVMIKKKQ